MRFPTLSGGYIRLEPLSPEHIDGLTAAAAADPSLYLWTVVPQGKDGVARYVETALKLRNEGTTLPFATVRVEDGAVIGATRYFDIERWAWPQEHPRHGGKNPDVCEIGYTWLTQSAMRTAANTEAKLLMLTYAFESWELLRVCLHTDARNERSRAAIERIGGKLEGILRAHRMASDFTPRESARYSVLASEWPAVKQRLMDRLQRQG